ncbi:transcription factor bHLH30-like [Coffea arabica]|uniref:Transcription factor bHLH30-like n=1 Tax=Coffea arabica TaxID=13443 RepID=A0ABM4VTL1_COFAR
MLQVQGCYGLQYTKKDGAGVLSSGSGLKTPEKNPQAAANKHALAERYRRKRINNHLNTLRKLFPNLPKSDKPRVLMETVRYLKELRKKVADHVEMNKDGQEECCIGGKRSCSLFLPGEKDEVSVSYYSEGEGGDHGVDQGELLMVKATICCEDRPRLNADLMEAVKSVEGRVVKAEMGTIGGRTKAVLVVQWCQQSLHCGVGGGGGGEEEEEEVGSLRKALRAVVENRALTPSLLLGPELLISSWTDRFGP